MKTTKIIVFALGTLAVAEPSLAQRQGPRGLQEPTCTQTVAEAGGLGARRVGSLQNALAEEYVARDYYRAAAERFGLRQFANHARAEENHIAALSRILRAAGAKPVAKAGRTVEVPRTLEETEAVAAQLERRMIGTYDALLQSIDIEGIRSILERIQAANHRHLASAQGERAEGSRGRGRGRGGPAGRGRGPARRMRHRGNRIDFADRCAFGSRPRRR